MTTSPHLAPAVVSDPDAVDSPPMGFDVLVVQHGEKERLPGDPGLTKVGRAQAEATATWLARSVRADELWSSPMRRAVETADPIARRLELDASTDNRFRERMNWEGDEAQPLADFLADWDLASRDRTYVPRSGDSSFDAGARFVAALDDLARRRPHGTVVVVAHGGVTVDALRTIAGDDAVGHARPDLVRDGVPCCAVTRLRRDGGRWLVVAFPQTDHLDDVVDHRPG
jgi:broad specificity phosphatase PhoE